MSPTPHESFCTLLRHLTALDAAEQFKVLESRYKQRTENELPLLLPWNAELTFADVVTPSPAERGD